MKNVLSLYSAAIIITSICTCRMWSNRRILYQLRWTNFIVYFMLPFIMMKFSWISVHENFEWLRLSKTPPDFNENFQNKKLFNVHSNLTFILWPQRSLNSRVVFFYHKDKHVDKQGITCFWRGNKNVSESHEITTKKKKQVAYTNNPLKFRNVPTAILLKPLVAGIDPF